MTGENILQLAEKHPGEHYILVAQVSKNNASWKGPWDCAELVTWIIYQTSAKFYECNNSLGNPDLRGAYTGYWRDHAEKTGKINALQQAIKIPGAAISPDYIIYRFIGTRCQKW